MLDDYFQHQADLSDLECNLRCPNDCSAPGCWMADVIVEATLFDLIKLSRVLNIPVSRLFPRHCHLMKGLVRPGVVNRLENEHIKRLKRSLLSPEIYFM